MSILYTKYDPITGEIIGNGQCAEERFAARSNVIEGSYNRNTEYVNILDGFLPIPRPSNNATIDKTTITADGTDEAIMTGITNPSTVSITSADTEPISEVCTDGRVEFATETPGEYIILITPPFPEQTKTFTVIAE